MPADEVNQRRSIEYVPPPLPGIDIHVLIVITILHVWWLGEFESYLKTSLTENYFQEAGSLLTKEHSQFVKIPRASTKSLQDSSIHPSPEQADSNKSLRTSFSEENLKLLPTYAQIFEVLPSFKILIEIFCKHLYSPLCKDTCGIKHNSSIISSCDTCVKESLLGSSLWENYWKKKSMVG
jgi:hypothetical protein